MCVPGFWDCPWDAGAVLEWGTPRGLWVDFLLNSWTDSRKCIPLMPFDMYFFPLFFLLLAAEVSPQKYNCCWREIGFSSRKLHKQNSWAVTHYFYFTHPPWEKSPLSTPSAKGIATAIPKSPDFAVCPWGGASIWPLMPKLIFIPF